MDECGATTITTTTTTTTTGTNTSKTSQHYNIKGENLKYASYDSRMETFKKWPKCFAKYYTDQLSEAGFFYTGISDRIECFFCGVRLSNWNDSDNPLEQHIVWSRNCPFLKMTKGTIYIQQAREKFVVKIDDDDDDDDDNFHE